MSDNQNDITPVTIEGELQQSYLDYAMSVIVGRALPDVRDGLKPVHRRVLYAMYELGNDYNKPYKKSARVVGDVVGKYHPHGDAAVYDTIVRMAQGFTMRYPLVDGQGNFGSIDGDAPAAMRYTEIRMAKIAHSLLADIDKETVEFAPNYDGTEMAPTVLPTKVPNLLVNGASGIAVGMATNIPPHNMGEIIDGCLALINDPDLSVDDLMHYIPGPDFPTAAYINGRGGIKQAYRTGRGRIRLRAKTMIEDLASSGKKAIIVKEFPYQVNKARLIEKVGELVRDKQIDGISALRDESDKEGIRVVIELKKGENPEVILNKLYAQTQLESVYGINMVALDRGQPRSMNLRQVLQSFIKHRREVVTKRTIYQLRKARERAHILEGLGVSLTNIDEIVRVIKQSSGSKEAKEQLMSRDWPAGAVLKLLDVTQSDIARPEDLELQYGLHDTGYRLSPAQAQAILDMRLHRLTALEQDKIFNEYKELIEQIKELLDILNHTERLLQLIREELLSIKETFNDKRRTEILEAQEELTEEDLIEQEEVVVTISHEGYAKIQTLDGYRAQRRGGKGKSATSVKDEDFVEQLVIANTHDTLLCFSDHGKVYWLKAYMLPQGGRAAKGKPLINLLSMQQGENITAVLPISQFDPTSHVLMATAKGIVKKVPLDQFARPRATGIIAVGLANHDYLISAILTEGDSEVVLFTDGGKAVRFHEDDVRDMGRNARGVKGVNLAESQNVIALIKSEPGSDVLTVTENGYGKRTPLDHYPRRSRASKGVLSIQKTEKTGSVVSAIQISQDDEVMLITNRGTLVRIQAGDISIRGRNTQGVKLITPGKGEHLVGVQRISEPSV